MGMVLYLRRETGEPIPEDPEEFHERYFFDEQVEAAGDLIDFDKAWHGLHFILTGAAEETDHPLSLFGRGEPVGADSGYGPPCLLSAEEIADFNDALAALSDDELHRRYDPKAILDADLYLAESLADEEFGWEYISQGMPNLRRFAERCVQHGSGAIILLS